MLCVTVASSAGTGSPAQYKKDLDIKTAIKSLSRIPIGSSSAMGDTSQAQEVGNLRSGRHREVTGSVQGHTARRRWAGPERALTEEGECEKTRAEQ